MSLNFRYIDYKKNITNSLTRGKNSSEILIFSNYILKNIYSEKKKRTREFLGEEPIIAQYDTFFKELFPTDKIILKESVRIITLFKAIPEEIKEKLQIKNYNECITFGNEFFRFYSDKKQSLVKEFKNLQKWQLEKIELLEVVKKIYDEYLRNNNFIPSDWVCDLENLDLSYLDSINKVVFIDVIEFTPLEREVIKRIAEKCNVEIVIQCEKNDFDEEKFKMKSIILPEEKPDMKVYETSEELEIGVNILSKLKNSEENDSRIFENIILTPNIEQCQLHKIFPSSFLHNSLNTLDNTDLFDFFMAQYEILSTVESQLEDAISLLCVETHINNLGFRNNYDIKEEDIKVFYEIIRDDFKYFSPKLLKSRMYEEFLDKNITKILLRIHEDIKLIKTFVTVEEFFLFFKEKCNLLKIVDNKHVDIFNKLTMAIFLAKTCETIDEEITFKELFSDNVPLGIYKLIINDMKNIELDRVKYEKNKFKGYINSLSEAYKYHGNEIYVVNVESENLPGNIGGKTIFTESQKKENNLITKEQERLNLKYRFFQSIFISKKCEIYYRKNDTNLKISPFLEEVMNHYKIEKDIPNINLEQCMKLLKKSLYEKEAIIFSNNKEWNLKKEKTDFIKNSEKPFLFLAPYSYDNMVECEFRFYLENILGISNVKEKFERNFSLKFLGVFTHIFLENIARKMEKKILEDGNLLLDESFVKEELDFLFYENRYKIPVHLDIYIKEVLLKNIVKNTMKFYEALNEKFFQEKIVSFSAEKEKDENKIFLYGEVPTKLGGRVDLMIESKNKKIILDYKTGKMKKGQLDFYSILLFGESDLNEKGIFNVFEGKIEYDDERKLTSDSLKKSIVDFLAGENYKLAENKQKCTYCSFINICRKEG